jgi:hypothetical protein
MAYAAMDCAVDATHLADWVLRAVNDDHHKRLTGKAISPKNEVDLQGFDAKNKDRISSLALCRDIANHAKHVLLTRSKSLNIGTGRSIKFDPPIKVGQPFPENFKANAYVYIIEDGQTRSVLNLFEDAAAEWKTFLIEEGLFDHDLDDHLNFPPDPWPENSA